MINQLSKKITTYPKLILMVLGISIACLCYFIQYFGIDASEDTLVNKSDAHFIYSKKIKKTYNLDRFLILVYKPHHNIFSNQGLDLIKALKQAQYFQHC
jgi:predicted RND superfamily exporter protein